MRKRFKVSPLENSKILRRFSILFFVMAVIPVSIIYYFYRTISHLDVPENNLVIPFLLTVIGLCIGYWGMRVVLKDLVRVVKVHAGSLENLLGPEKYQEIMEGKSEIDILARTFDEVIYQLEDSVRRLEITKKTLNSVLTSIGDGLSSSQDITSFLGLIIKTIAEALNAKVGVLMLVDESGKHFTVRVAHGVDAAVIPAQKIPVQGTKFQTLIQGQKPHMVLDCTHDDVPLPLRKMFVAPVLCAPLLFHNKFLGVIALNGRPAHEITDDERNLLFNVALQTAVAIENSRLSENAEKIYLETISALALAVEAKDRYSRGHLDRVAQYAAMVANKIGLSRAEVKILRDAARLHDIGKIGILDEVLRKPGKLTMGELRMMRKHTEIGEGIIAPIRSMRDICNIVRHHHEYLDGTGYPDRLSAKEINPLTRILIVADIFDALTSDRPYRDAMSKEEAWKVMTEEYREKLDQDIVKILFESV